MTEDDARAAITLMLQPDAKPALTSDEVDQLVTAAVTADSVDVAVALGWMAKAAKVAGKFDVKSGSLDASQSQMHAMCLRQAGVYATAAGYSIPGVTTTNGLQSVPTKRV